jgi:hypothetical protein
LIFPQQVDLGEFSFKLWIVTAVGLSEADETSVLTFDNEAEPIRVIRSELRPPLSFTNVDAGTAETKGSIRGVPRRNMKPRQS